MNNKLPKVFVNKGVKSNNLKSSYNKSTLIDDVDVKKQVLDIVNAIDFVYCKKVNILYKNGDSEILNLIGIVNDQIITLEKQSINLNEIRSIKKVDVTLKS